jgi:hypothetical protein
MFKQSTKFTEELFSVEGQRPFTAGLKLFRPCSYAVPAFRNLVQRVTA